MRSAILPLFRTFMKRGNGAGDAAALEAARDGTIALFGLVDRHLAQHAYMAGDAFSMGDIPLGVWAYRYTLLVPDGPDFPSLARWRRLLEERPAYREHVMLPPE
ncbi:MAG: glutathione binding-like protein [Noviherbaspirillum sp.]